MADKEKNNAEWKLEDIPSLELDLRAQNTPFRRMDETEFRLGGYDAQGKLWLSKPPVVIEAEPFLQEESTFVLKSEAVQKLMDDLWNVGFRPTKDPEIKQGHLEAVNYHLEDMRKVAFSFLDELFKRDK